MANHTTGAQRYNKRMDKVWDNIKANPSSAMKKEAVAKKMGEGQKGFFALQRGIDNYHKDLKKHLKRKGRASLNPPKKGRDNEAMEGKGEQELN